ncbi:hypothetical protein QYE76_005533 [Lolium multiflorum]|uniref:Uncharacterized protein n=1 Tax=Lolium multiflorum TaxID=4521 RepID=A0AAD8W388_LOLMU|nr:hypothetical protein QYE76_005533 [Lolium multiflorum]
MRWCSKSEQHGVLLYAKHEATEAIHFVHSAMCAAMQRKMHSVAGLLSMLRHAAAEQAEARRRRHLPDERRRSTCDPVLGANEMWFRIGERNIKTRTEKASSPPFHAPLGHFALEHDVRSGCAVASPAAPVDAQRPRPSGSGLPRIVPRRCRPHAFGTMRWKTQPKAVASSAAPLPNAAASPTPPWRHCAHEP